jgi:hypothetical protein
VVWGLRVDPRAELEEAHAHPGLLAKKRLYLFEPIAHTHTHSLSLSLSVSFRESLCERESFSFQVFLFGSLSHRRSFS